MLNGLTSANTEKAATIANKGMQAVTFRGRRATDRALWRAGCSGWCRSWGSPVGVTIHSKFTKDKFALKAEIIQLQGDLGRALDLLEKYRVALRAARRVTNV
jgi:hypothetical protein